MIVRLPEWNGQVCDYTGQPTDYAYGYFARGATGRVCLVLLVDKTVVSEDELDRVSTLAEVQAWAESVPGGYLDYEGNHASHNYHPLS